FKAAAYLALLKGDIGDSDHALLMRVAAGEKHILSDGKPIVYRSLSLMNLHLHDCLVIDACAKPGYTCWVIVYIPDDPDHPIK
ncbi:dermonecrotic toxin domain-containing protein, partial [Neisseria meningitidis]